MKTVYHPQVRRELQQIIDYYNECSKGLGNTFLNDFEQHVFNISSSPTRWIVIEGEIRRSLMKRFPYVVYFRVIDNDIILITIIKHQRRNPSYGRTRN